MGLYRNLCIWAFVMGIGVLAATPAYAAYNDVSEMSKGLTDMFKSLGSMTMYGIFFVGLLAFGYGLYSLAFPNSRMESNKGKAIACLAIGALMMAGSGGVNMISGSVTGGEAIGLGELGID